MDRSLSILKGTGNSVFETIQFWPNLRVNLKEIKRVLKPSGTFLIVSRHTKPDSKWTEFLQLHTPEEYRDSLNEAGYVGITIDDSSKLNWILALAKKPSASR